MGRDRATQRETRGAGERGRERYIGGERGRGKEGERQSDTEGDTGSGREREGEIQR